jgi:hypothetical protein
MINLIIAFVLGCLWTRIYYARISKQTDWWGSWNWLPYKWYKKLHMWNCELCPKRWYCKRYEEDKGNIAYPEPPPSPPKRIFIVNTDSIIVQLYRDKIIREIKESMRKVPDVPQPAGPIYPEPPPMRIIREGDTGRKCPMCGSSLSKRNIYNRTKHCIQSKCVNYW